MFVFHWSGRGLNTEKGGKKRKVLMLSIVLPIVAVKDPFKRYTGAIIACLVHSVKGVLGSCLCSVKTEGLLVA